MALRELKAVYGHTLAGEFGPKALRTVRQRMVEKGWCRNYVNQCTSLLKHVFRWAVAEELVPATIFHALQAVAGLKRGRTEARETEPVKPVPQAHVDAIQPFVRRQVWAIVQLQLLSGARPGELVVLRAMDIDMSGKIWICHPSGHKTAHHGHQRRIYLGLRSQKVINPYLVNRAIDAYLFSPAEAELERRERLHQQRKTPMSCGNVPGSRRKDKPKRQPRNRYDRDSYRRAIQRAYERANVPSWHPHQLRHNAGTFIRKEDGLDAARIILGHKSPIITEIYAEQDHNRALDIVSKIG